LFHFFFFFFFFFRPCTRSAPFCSVFLDVGRSTPYTPHTCVWVALSGSVALRSVPALYAVVVWTVCTQRARWHFCPSRFLRTTVTVGAAFTSFLRLRNPAFRALRSLRILRCCLAFASSLLPHFLRFAAPVRTFRRSDPRSVSFTFRSFVLVYRYVSHVFERCAFCCR